MSSSDDDEWEREQMLRGIQSRQKYSQQGPQSAGASKTAALGPQFVDANYAKEHVSKEIERLTLKLEETKRTVGSLRREMAERENRKTGLKRLIEQLRATVADKSGQIDE